MKNMYTSYLIDKQLKHLLHNKFSTQNGNAGKEIKAFLFNNIFRIGSFSNNPKKKVMSIQMGEPKRPPTNIPCNFCKHGKYCPKLSGFYF